MKSLSDPCCAQVVLALRLFDCLAWGADTALTSRLGAGSVFPRPCKLNVLVSYLARCSVHNLAAKFFIRSTECECTAI